MSGGFSGGGRSVVPRCNLLATSDVLSVGNEEITVEAGCRFVQPTMLVFIRNGVNWEN